MSVANMDHLAVLPVLLPAATAVLLLAVGDGEQRRGLARVIAGVSLLIGLALAVALLQRADAGSILAYRVGDWPAPFGIVLVIDRLSALMLLLVAVLALPVLWAATQGWDTRGRHFHALLQFQLMGLNGAFVTGDLFNLFVFFEVLLIASYVLMMHGLGRERLRAGLHYVVLNLVASALFLLGVALVYASTGTLNLADLALRVPVVASSDATLLRAGTLLLLVVFAFKAALMPLALWLPATYSASAAPVAALFAIMTKVGVYALLRVHGVALADADGAVPTLLLVLALATGLCGAVAAMAAATLPRLVAWLTVASVGTVVAALGVGGPAAWAAGLVYLVHSTLLGAALFLLADAIAARRGDAGGVLRAAGVPAQAVLLGLLTLVAAASAAGLPPWPGFIGKVMLLQAAAPHAAAAWVWAVVLGVGFLTLLAWVRAGSLVFWSGLAPSPRLRTEGGGEGSSGGALPPSPQPSPALRERGQGAAGSPLPAALLLALGALLAVFAHPVQQYATAAAGQLADRAAYARAVLPEIGGERANSVRPYRHPYPAAAPEAPR
jgi:multicomponent K+:H+ antiporter subunit D